MKTAFTGRDLNSWSDDEILALYADLTSSGRRMYLYWYPRTHSHELSTLLASSAYHDEEAYQGYKRENRLWGRRVK